MSSPLELIKQYRDRIMVLEKEISSHPFHYSPGFRWKEESNYNYRLQREKEIDQLRKKISDEETRNQLLQHSLQNKKLADLGLPPIKEKPTPLENFTKFFNEATPVGLIGNKVVAPVAQGIGEGLSSGFTWVLLIGGAIVLFMIFSKR